MKENYNDQDGEQQEGTLSKRRFHGSVDRQHQSKRACKDGDIHHEAKLCQRAAQTAFYKGKQQRLPFAEMPKAEEARQWKNAKARQRTMEKQHQTNFYALDVETSGFVDYEPIQVAVVLFLKGVAVKYFNMYFLPTSEIT